MVTVGMNYHILEGKNELFESVFYKVLQVMNDMEGHKESHLFRDVQDSQKYLILSEWHTHDAFKAFTTSERFKGVVDWGKEQVLAGRPVHEVYGKDEPVAATATGGGCPMHK
jgi:heme-degrading monooxygenase HmoA